MDWETGIDVCAPARVRQELSSVLCVTKTGGMWAGWEEGKKTGYIYTFLFFGVGRVYPCCFPVAGFFGSKSGYMRQKENPGNSPLCCALGPEIPSQTAFSSHFRVSLLVLYINSEA